MKEYFASRQETKTGNAGRMNEEINALLRMILETEELRPERLQKLEACEFLIILDMGCGSTSAAVLDLKGYMGSGEAKLSEYLYPVLWNYRVPSVRDGGMLETASRQVSIPTLIGYSDLKPLIGPEALRTGNVCENFKACPSDQNLNRVALQIATWDGQVSRRLEEVWRDYFGCIMDQICLWSEKNQIGPADRQAMHENTLMMVAHPAGGEWTQSCVLKSYRDMIAKGTGLPEENIFTISEAKAVMQYVRRKYGQELDFEKGVVIIDIGASTIDMEYLAKDLPEPYEYSLTMAGRDVDLLLLHHALEEAFPATMQACSDPRQLPEESFFTEHCSCGSALLKWNMRAIKEDISDAEYDPAQRGRSFETVLAGKKLRMSAGMLCGLLGDEERNPLTGAVFGRRSFPVSYPLEAAFYIRSLKARTQEAQPEGFAVQVVEDTWYGHLENLIRYVMDDLSASRRRAAQVIVTGGSCRLTGIRPHIWKAVRDSEMGSFVCREDQILYMDAENDYENSVPFGGGYYVGGLLGRLGALRSFPDRLYGVLFRELTAVAAREITREVNYLVRGITLDTLAWWKDLPDRNVDGSRDIRCSVNGLNERLENDCRRAIHVRGRLDEAVARAVKRITLRDSLPDTMREIGALLDNLAGARFTGKVSAEGVRVFLPVESVSGAVRRIEPDALTLDFWQSAGGLLQDLGNAFLTLLGKGIERDDIPRSVSYRTAVYKAYRESGQSAVGSALEQEIARKLQGELEKTYIFGIPARIIRELKQDILCALYLS